MSEIGIRPPARRMRRCTWLAGVAGMRAQVELRNRGSRPPALRDRRCPRAPALVRRRRDSAGGNSPRVTARELHGIARHAARDQRLLQPVFPGGCRGRRDLRLDGGDVFDRRARPAACAPAGAGAPASESEICTWDSTCVPPKRCAHDAFDALAHLGVVAVARHVHQAGIETLVAVASHEQAHAAAFVEIDDAAHDGDELGRRRLEQFVAREGLDDVDHGLGVVALRRQAEMLDHRVELAAQQRNLRGRRVIGARGPQAEKAMFAGDIAGGIEGLDADVVEITGAMHRRRWSWPW